MPDKTLKVPRSLTRAASIAKMGDDGKTVTLSISSDEPYKRYDWWADEEYWEVLDHGPNGIDEERLKAGLPILFNHERGQHLGRGVSYDNDGHKLTVTAKFSESPFAQEKLADVKSGVLVDSSVGYELVGDGICVGAKDELPVYKFRFKVYEGSLVTVPADCSVGVGRQRDKAPDDQPKEILIKSIDSNSQTVKKTETQPKLMTPEEIAAKEKADRESANKLRAEAVAEHKAKCKKIDEFCDPAKNPAMKNEAWRKKAIEVAAKHKDGEADYDAFRQEAFGHFTSETVIDTPLDGERGRVEVVGERGTIGQQFIRSQEVKNAGGRMRRGQSISVEMPGASLLGARGKAQMARAGFTSADLAAVNVTVNPQILALGVQRLTILDVIGSGTIGTGAYKYARENGFGSINGVAVAAGAMPRAAAVGERGLKPNWESDLSTETATVAKVAITTKVPDEFLSDFPSAMSYIDDRLPFMVDTETEFQVLYGDGLNNNLKGILTTAGVQTRAITTTDDSTKAASIRQGLTDIQVGAQFEPDFIGFHPYDWETAQLLKDSTGRFLAGGPYYIPLTAGLYQEMHTFWGKPVVITTAITYGKPIAGAGKIGAAALIREGMRIEMTNANEDDFRRNLVCLRAEHRLALPVYRPVAFLEFTGWPARA